MRARANDTLQKELARETLADQAAQHIGERNDDRVDLA